MATPNADRPAAARADHDPLKRLNDHRRDDLLLVARWLGEHPDATSARAARLDTNGIDLSIQTPNGDATAHIPFPAPAPDAPPPALRRAVYDLVKRARSKSGANPRVP